LKIKIEKQKLNIDQEKKVSLLLMP
jgi:hypothetical protein